MSYLLDGLNDFLTATLTTAVGYPCTIAIMVKFATHPAAADTLITLGFANGSTNESHTLRCGAVANFYQMTSTDGAGATSSAQNAIGINNDGIWAPYVGVITSSSSRDLYVLVPANVTANTGTRTVSAGTWVRIGTTLTGGLDLTGRVAEAAVWDKALSAGEIASYMNFESALTVAAANLRGYWPMSYSNATQDNEGLDSAGDMTVTSAVYDSDHPTITTPGAAAAPQLFTVRSAIRLGS